MNIYTPPPLSKTSHIVPCREQAFTLVEMMVGIAIVGVLAVLLSSAFSRATKRAQQSVCVANLKQIGTAMGAFLGDNNGAYPPAYEPLAVQNNSIWYHKLLNGSYLDTDKVLFCPLSKNTPPDRKMATQWGGISYGMNLALSTDYAVSENLISPARIGSIAKPAGTVFAVDSGMAEGASYQTYYVYPSRPPGAQDSAAWPRHERQCNVLWADGHVTSVNAPTEARGSIYDKDALGQLGEEPNHWKRN